MNTVMKLEPKDIDAVPFQEASLDIWDKKYRLTAKDGTPIDKTMDDGLSRHLVFARTFSKRHCR